MTNVEIRAAIQALTQAAMAQANRDVASLTINVNVVALRVKEFLRMNPPKIYVSKVEEDPKYFIDEVYKVLAIMGLTTVEKVKLATNQLRDITQIWYECWKDNRSL